MSKFSNLTFLEIEKSTILHRYTFSYCRNKPAVLTPSEYSPQSRTCVQPFRNRALSPPQPLTSAWMPSFVTWSHQEIFSCSSSGHPSLRRQKEKRVETWFCFGRKSCFKPEPRKFPFLEAPRAQTYTRSPHPHGERCCQTSSPDAKSSPEAASGALKQGTSRVKDDRSIPFWTPPSS